MDTIKFGTWNTMGREHWPQCTCRPTTTESCKEQYHACICDFDKVGHLDVCRHIPCLTCTYISFVEHYRYCHDTMCPRCRYILDTYNFNIDDIDILDDDRLFCQYHVHPYKNGDYENEYLDGHICICAYNRPNKKCRAIEHRCVCRWFADKCNSTYHECVCEDEKRCLVHSTSVKSAKF